MAERFENLESTGYSVGKVNSERLFAEAAEEAGTWDAITCNPSDNVGPIQSKHHKESGPWQHNIETMLWRTESHPDGWEQNAGFRPWMVVDVRDDAECHVRLLESTAVKNGERYVRARPLVCRRCRCCVLTVVWLPSPDRLEHRHPQRRGDCAAGIQPPPGGRYQDRTRASAPGQPDARWGTRPR